MIDAGEIYESLKGRLTTTLRKSLGVTGIKTLKVNRVWADDNLDPQDFQGQLDAKLNMRSWAIPVYADISLVDPASGKEIDRAKKIRLMEIPKITPRQSFIVGGEEFQVANQLRLKSGVYVKSVPSETSAHFKFPIGYSKRNFSMDYDPAEKKWTAFLDGKTVPLYSYLNALGLTDEEISEKLGQEHLDKMKADADLRKDLAKIRTVVTGEKGLPGEPATNANRIREVLYALPMGPDVPRLKYGKEYKKFDKGLVLDALGNLQGVLSGEEEPDIDNSRFKEFRTFDDILVERIEKTTPLLQGRIKQRMREKTAIRDIIQPDKLSDVVTSFFNRSQLSNYPTQSNPINFLSGHTRTTVFGEGSIGNKRAVTNVERGVDPSMMGTIDPLHSPEGGDIGAVMHITVGAKKGDGVILRTFWDPKTQKHVTLGHPDVYNKRIAFPNEYKREPSGRFVPVDPSIRVMHRGKVLTVSPAEVDLIVERPQDLFDFSTNLVPFVNAMHGGRGLMASKMYDQAVSVINPEPPLVRSASTPKKALDETFERIVGGLAATKSPVDGTVDEVADRQITVRDGAGKSHKVNLYKDFPLNSRSFITSKSKVGVGDKVKKGDVLADSNFTKDGDLAIGKNLLMGWVPYRGWSYEDSIVMSESAAKKMTSEHLYKVDHRDSPEGLSGRDRYAAYFPNRFTAEQLAKLDDDGVVKIGTTVRSGDPLVVYLAKKNITPEDVVLGKISRNLVRPYSDASQTWEEPFNGVVTHVQRTAGGRAKVLVKTEEPLQTGDKVVSRYAAKGLVSRVVPDEEMPRTKDGRTLELLLNPIGLPSRMNPAQIYEALAGKIAVKTGKPYVVDNFEPGDLRERIRGDLKKAGLSETEEVIDPVSGRSLGQVTVGNQFLMKLEHAAKEKFNAREPSGAYTADLRPAKSGEGAQAIGHMEQSALLSHGALYNLRDFTNYKAGKNDEFWRALQMNEPLPPPTSTFAFDKFVALLKGAGINVERRGTQFQLKPLTDDQTEGMSAGAISSSRMLLGKNLKPEKGGLFDEEVTGGLTGQRWAHVDLPYEVPNPVFEPAIRGVMGLTQREYDDIIEERVSVDAFAKPTPKEQGGLTGPAALRRMLGQIDIPKAIQELKRQARIAKGSDLNHFNRAIRFLSNLRTNQISTDDLFIKKVPVLPPIYRPVYPLPDGTLNVSDVNYLYRDLVAIKNQLADLSKVLPEEHLREQRADLYQAVKAIAGTGDPVSSEHYRGILDIVTGEYPKGSYFQSRVIRKQQELSGRAAISGDPTLGMDEVGIPEDMAWVIFKPFAVRKMVERGMAPLEAERHIADRTMIAKDALGRAMAERPVIVNRAPTLHKHGIIALKPTLVPDKSVHLNQMVTVGLGADFDGDTVGIHVPVTDEAVREAQEMMPSTMPLSTSEKVLTVPRHESLVGLYRLTSAGKKTSKTYVSEIEAVMAFHKGEISETDVVQVGGVETTVGRVLVNKTLPEKLRRPDLVIDSKKASEIVGAIARENPRALAPVVDTLKDVGNEYAFLSGLSVGIDDLHIPKARVDEVMSKYDSQAAEATRTTKNRKELDRKVVQIYSKAYGDLKVLTSKDFADRNTSLGQMVTSGGRGNIDQAAQMLTAPVLVEDVRGKIHPYPIRTGYAHGMTPPDFWVANYGSRKGAVETKLSTAEPGALTKSMVQTSIENRIAPGAPPSEERGLEFSVDDRESIGRYVMAEYPGLARRGDLFDAQLRNRLKAAGKKTVELGSPLMSTHPQGTYLWSYGLDERGRQPRPGAFIGVTAAQAIGEPMTQLILGSKHVQGLAGQARTAGSGEAAVATMTGFQKLKTLLEMPEKVDQKALVAREGGIVESVQKAPGGWDVRLDGKTHFTAFEPTVKAGARVNPGDRLSQGLVDPRDLLETKGIDHTRKYLVDEIFGIFGGKVRKKHIETVVRSVTDTALVTDSGQRTDFVEGDIVPINVVRAENRKGAVPVSLDLARNAMLMEEVDRLGGAEKILTDEDIATLKEMGRDQVIANPNPVKFRPILKGVELTPMARKDWIAGLSYRRLKDVITKGVAEGWKSDLKGWNPIPGLAYGAAIEEPKKTSA